MAKPLIPLTISAPGFLGLNTQRSGSVLPPGWATVLSNIAYDDFARISSRRGSKQTNAASYGAGIPKAIHEYIDDTGAKVNIFASDLSIWKEVSGTITDISGTITAPTDNLWKFQNFNGTCVGYQKGHTPIVLTTVGGTFADAGGTQINGNTVLSAYGRLWTISDSVLYYSDLLINDYAGPGGGNFDLAKFWPNGMDEGVALADFNGYLIVFGKESIIVYENADDVANMVLVEGINGIGCIARDTVQTVGKEVVFLSSSGLRSLQRTIQNESMPMTDISQHVRDDLLAAVFAETPDEIKSVYNEDLGFYLISLPTSGKSYYFDLKFPNQDNTWKATNWDIAPSAIMYAQDNTMYMGLDAGFLSTYTGFLDGVAAGGTGGSTYMIDFEGVWNDFSQVTEEVAQLVKIPKNVSLLAAGTSGGDVVFKWALDYQSVFSTVTLNFSGTAPPQYGGNFTWGGVYLYATGGDFERIRSPIGSAGQVIKVGLTTTIDGFSFALQRIDVLAKVGKIGL